MTSYRMIGLMSGTSMDGVDIALCEFSKTNDEWVFHLTHSDTYEYDQSLRFELNKAGELPIAQLLQLDKKLGRIYADMVNDFLLKNEITIDFIDALCSHGQTILHQPENGFTLQIGCGETLSYHTGIQVINDFRTKNIVAGGQGAPLVPIGDKLLFPLYSTFLNIGGFTNISFTKNTVQAYDICPGNLPLNHFATLLGRDYDKNGEIASTGKLIPVLFERLNQLSYYNKTAPKSLGTEWLTSVFYPVISPDLAPRDVLRTLVEHIAYQIGSALNKEQSKEVLITGGGAKNKFLLDRINHHYKGAIVVPNIEIVDQKEALIFAFLGCLFLEDQPNTLSSVTGSEKDVIGGVLHKP